MTVQAGFSRREDIPALSSLWSEAFVEDMAYPRQYFSGIYQPERVLVLRKAEKILSMALWFPGILRKGDKRVSCAYLYAVATGKEYRGQGLAHRLLAFGEKALKEKGIEALALVPASSGLASFYGAMGYRPFFYREREFYSRPVFGYGKITPCGPEEYAALRGRSLKNSWHFSFSQDGFFHGSALLSLDQGGYFKLKSGSCSGCGAAYLENGKVVVKELFWDGPRPIAAGLFSSAFSGAPVELFFPGKGELQGMLKWDDGVFSADETGFLGMDFS